MFKRQQKETSSPASASGSPATQQKKFYLPSSLRVEVRSPGFSSRLSALIHQGNDTENRRVASPLRPPSAASNFNPKYNGFGSRPKISFDRSPLPILSARNSAKVGPHSRFSPRSPVTMVKVAPSAPFSPFRSVLPSRSSFASSAPVSSVTTPNNTTTTISDIGGTSSGIGGVADPRRVLVALQELSRSRKRGLNRRLLKCAEDDDDDDDEEEETGSKRARRDSSSSIGSSLSMEMPPLFSNGVIGQTTSHLVSRETDLSLNSLLSRSQSIFGHATKSTLSSHVHHQQQQQQQIQQLSQQQQSSTASRKQKTINNAITSSLSSSIHMKRGRDESSSESSSSSDESDALNSSKSRIAAPGRSSTCRNVDKKRARLSNAASPTTTDSSKKRVAFADNEMPGSSSMTSSASPMLSGVAGKSSMAKRLHLPTISAIIGGKKLSPKKSLEVTDFDLEAEAEKRKPTISSIEALDNDREKNKRRADNLLSIFEGEKVAEKPASKISFSIPDSAAPSLPKTPAESTVPSVASFFTPPTSSQITATSTPDEKAPVEETKQDKPDDKKGETTTPAETSTTITTTTTLPVSETATSTVAATTPSLPPPYSAPTTTTAPASITSPALAGFTFGALGKPAVSEPSTTLATLLSTSTTTPASVSVTSSASVPTTTSVSAESGAKPSFAFAFGATSSQPTTTSSTTTTAAATAPLPAIFAFGASSLEKKADAVTSEKPAPVFSFGATSTPALPKSDDAPKIPTFGSTTIGTFGSGLTKDSGSSTLSFAFGDAVKKVDEKASLVSVTTTAAPASSVFSFGSSLPKTTTTTAASTFNEPSKPATTFAFGASTTAVDKKEPTFAFGVAAKTTEDTTKQPATFSFGGGVKTDSDASSVFTFGKPAESKASILGGSTSLATTTTASANPFQFGLSTAASSVTSPMGQADGSKSTSLFQFGAAPASASSTATAATATVPKSFSFGSTSMLPTAAGAATPSNDLFKFGGSTGTSTTPAFSFGAALKSDANTQQAAPPSFQQALSSTKSASFSTFGSSAPAPTPSGVFSFGASSTPAVSASAPSTGGVFQFGGAASAPSPFGPPAATPAPGGFGSVTSSTTFGSASSGGFGSTPAPGGFGSTPAPGGFGAAPPSGGFNFGGGASSTPSFAFGATQGAPASSTGGFAFGAASSAPANPSFGAIASPPQAPGAMFSIGSGTGTPKGRTIARARRTRR